MIYKEIFFSIFIVLIITGFCENYADNMSSFYEILSSKIYKNKSKTPWRIRMLYPLLIFHILLSIIVVFIVSVTNLIKFYGAILSEYIASNILGLRYIKKKICDINK